MTKNTMILPPKTDMEPYAKTLKNLKEHRLEDFDQETKETVRPPRRKAKTNDGNEYETGSKNAQESVF